MALSSAMEDYLEAVLILQKRKGMSDVWMWQISWSEKAFGAGRSRNCPNPAIS